MKGLNWVYLFSVQLRMFELYLCYNEVCYEGTYLGLPFISPTTNG